MVSASVVRAGQAPGLATRPSFEAFHGGLLPPVSPHFSGDWSVKVAFPHLTFRNPLGLLPLPGTSQLVVWEREGRIYSFNNSPDTTTKTLMLDISSQCQGWDDSGLLGVAFHPGFETNRQVFLYYSYVPPGTVQGNSGKRPPTWTPNRNRLERYLVDENGVINPASVTIFIDQISSTVWHNGGGLFFHPENGFLYLTNGDDAQVLHSQQIQSGLYSGVLRIDVDCRGGDISHPIRRQPLPAGSSTANYYIPSDNPFVGQPGVLEEFYAIGLRSPHRMTIDPPTGRIFIGDVGDGSFEELNVIEPGDPAGLNFQWSRIEGGNERLNPPYLGTDRPPLLAYSHADGGAIIGGYVYRGSEFAEDLGGKYIFGDNVANVIWMLDESTSPPTKHVLCTIPRGSGPNSGSDYLGLSSFGYDHDNELYMCQLSSTGGKIYKLQRSSEPVPRMPALLSETGVFADLATLAPATGFVHYEVNSPLWSDGAHKERWFAIPDGQQIGFQPGGEWSFPDGSVWVKHFELPVDSANPEVRRRLETRLLVRDTNGYVYGASYKWKPDGSDAEIVNGAVTEDISISLPKQTGNLTSVDIGASAPGATEVLPDGYQLMTGIAESVGADGQIRYAYEERTGDFDVMVLLSHIAAADAYARAGLLVRESMDPAARHIFAFAHPDQAEREGDLGRFGFQSRDSMAGEVVDVYPAAFNPQTAQAWLRLKRTGDNWAAYSSSDGLAWFPIANKTLVLPPTVMLGLALTTRADLGSAAATFRFPESRIQRWYYPSRQNCLSCHTRPTGGVLGMNTRQNNRDAWFTQTGVTDNQLRAWNHVDYFNPKFDEALLPGLLKLVTVTNQTASLEARVRSYLDANCSHCHRPGGAHEGWDARMDIPLALANIIDRNVVDNLGVPGAKNIAPRDSGRSVMYKRLSTAKEYYQMPPIAKNVVDADALSALAEWINSIPPPPQVVVTNPAASSVIFSPSKVSLGVELSTAGSAVTAVQYFVGGNKIGESTQAPFTVDWLVDQSGPIELTAVATDAAGLTGSSVPVSVSVIDAGTPGLLGEYFDGIEFTAKKRSRLDTAIDFDWGSGSPVPELGADNFSVRWTGTIQPTVTQVYTFHASADDGVRLWIDDELIIDEWRVQAVTEHTGSILLQAGRSYRIRLEMFESGGFAVVKLEWSGPDLERELVPSRVLRPPEGPDVLPFIKLLSPAGDALFYGPVIIPVEAWATNPAGALVKVEFLVDGVKLGEVTSPPYVWTWSRPEAGVHLLTARAVFNAGTVVETGPRTITVEPLSLQASFTLDGLFKLGSPAQSGQSYRIFRSSNLIDWEFIETVTAVDGVVEYHEVMPASPAWFYRISAEP